MTKCKCKCNEGHGIDKDTYQNDYNDHVFSDDVAWENVSSPRWIFDGSRDLDVTRSSSSFLYQFINIIFHKLKMR